MSLVMLNLSSKSPNKVSYPDLKYSFAEGLKVTNLSDPDSEYSSKTSSALSVACTISISY